MPEQKNLYKFSDTFKEARSEHGINYRAATFHRRANGKVQTRRAVVGFDSYDDNLRPTEQNTDTRIWYEIERVIKPHGTVYEVQMSLVGMKHSVTLIDSTREGLYQQIYEYVTAHYSSQEGNAMPIFEPQKSVHDFHLARADSPYTRYQSKEDTRLPKGFKWPKGATSVILASIDTDDRWKTTDNVWYTPINEKPIKCIIRQGERKEIIAIFPDELVYDGNKRAVQVWSSKYGYRADTASSAFHRTEDYEGTDFNEWADVIAKTVGRVIRTVKNL